jgi:hypothetical protein
MATKYRIVKRESFDLNNKLQVRFEPQHRFLGIFWVGFSESNCTWNRTFDTQKEAEEFLANVDRMGGSTSASTVVAEYK